MTQAEVAHAIVSRDRYAVARSGSDTAWLRRHVAGEPAGEAVPCEVLDDLVGLGLLCMMVIGTEVEWKRSSMAHGFAFRALGHTRPMTVDDWQAVIDSRRGAA